MPIENDPTLVRGSLTVTIEDKHIVVSSLREGGDVMSAIYVTPTQAANLAGQLLDCAGAIVGAQKTKEAV